MTIATKKGDGGTTQLLFGTLVSKDDLRVEAYGSVDELNSALGICRAQETDPHRKEWLLELQRVHFTLGAQLATPNEKQTKLKQRITLEHVAYLDERVALLEQTPGILDNWFIPGDSLLPAWYDHARSTCRKAERAIIRLHKTEPLGESPILPYINRLSDLLWLMAVTTN